MRATAAWLRRVLLAAVPLAQLTVAATAAWVIALQLGGGHEPFFAPISAIVALSSPLGERGSNAVRLLLGVLVGIGAGELTVLLLGGGYGRLALATFTALAVARLLGAPRLVLVQAAAGAILTVAAADGQAGVHRLVDAVIGAGVALTFSQVLFSPEPVALIRRAVTDALGGIATALTLTAEALERRDDDVAVDAVDLLREQRDNLTELARLRKASGRVARHSAIWRHRTALAVTEKENAGHLDLLDGSCLMLVRAVASGSLETADPAACSALGRHVRTIAGLLQKMAADPGDRATRQEAADRALTIAIQLAMGGVPDGVALGEAVRAARAVAVDVMVVAGVELEDALDAVRRGTGELHVPTPPRTPRLPFVERRPRRQP
jgi:hypothetical protein